MNPRDKSKERYIIAEIIHDFSMTPPERRKWIIRQVGNEAIVHKNYWVHLVGPGEISPDDIETTTYHRFNDIKAAKFFVREKLIDEIIEALHK